MDRTYRDRIVELVEPLVGSEGMELVDAECLRMKSRWLVRIYIDREGGATIDDCARVSHEIGDVLNVYNVPPGAYNLEVSTPGLDRPLIKDKDFMAFRGSRVKVKLGEGLDGRRNFRGLLKDCVPSENELILVLEVDGKEYRIPRSMVAKANLEYDLSHGGMHT